MSSGQPRQWRKESAKAALEPQVGVGGGETAGEGLSPHSGPIRRSLDARQCVEWAFAVEKAQIEIPEPRGLTERAFGGGRDSLSAMEQSAALGVRVDTSRGRSYPHDDAEIIAETVGRLPLVLGGVRMAIGIATLARACAAPDWMPGARPECRPVEWRENQHGRRAATEHVRTYTYRERGRERVFEGRCCPVRYVPHPDQIEDARSNYRQWRLALAWLGETLRDSGTLRTVEITEELPHPAPWEARPT